MKTVENARLQLISLESATVDSAVSKILRGISKLDLEVVKKPRWERLDLKRDNIAPYDLYDNQAQRKKLVKLGQQLAKDLAKNHQLPYVPPPTNVKKVRMKTIEVRGDHEEIRKILHISLYKELDMPGGIMLRMLPVDDR